MKTRKLYKAAKKYFPRVFTVQKISKISLTLRLRLFFSIFTKGYIAKQKNNSVKCFAYSLLTTIVVRFNTLFVDKHKINVLSQSKHQFIFFFSFTIWNVLMHFLTTTSFISFEKIMEFHLRQILWSAIYKVHFIYLFYLFYFVTNLCNINHPAFMPKNPFNNF